ncbi:hypothetical protein GE061_001561 [Apolygus lucorum]|uniref:Major facilitator superfamily (MFS) profile domain-containing protein n=1 Tax=Apolygus lucorum TaxID=248454 RepID=A0A8S9Y7F1_APOLU|nr:hypothetical protein GE061_001561 [Apolygus lucorum]
MTSKRKLQGTGEVVKESHRKWSAGLQCEDKEAREATSSTDWTCTHEQEWSLVREAGRSFRTFSAPPPPNAADPSRPPRSPQLTTAGRATHPLRARRTDLGQPYFFPASEPSLLSYTHTRTYLSAPNFPRTSLKAQHADPAPQLNVTMYNKFPVFSPAVRGILRQYLCSTTATIAVIMTGNAMGWPSPTHPLLLSPESPVPGMTTDDTSWMISLMYFGNLFSPIPCGYIMEAIGRKNTLLFLNVIPLASWLLIIFTKTVLWLYIARFLAGLWLGIVYTVVPIYLGEIAEPRVRGSLSTFFAIMTYVGVLFEYVVGPFVSYDNLAITSGMFCIIFYVTFTFMPETPYYLVKMNKSEEAREALFWLRGDTPDVDVELKKIENAVAQQMANKGTIKDLFATKANKKAVITVGVLSILQRLSGIGAMIAYTSVTLPKGAIHHVTTHQCVIVLGSVWVFSTLISSFLVDQLGRKILLIVSALGCGVATFLAGTWFLLDAKTDIDVTGLNWAPFACFLLHGFFYSIGLNPIVTTIKGEVFAASIKGVASAVTSLMLAVASFFLNKSYQIFADEIGMFANYWMYATGCFIAVIFTVTYVIETKGKTLQEIQDQLNGVTPPIDNKENIVSKL